MGSIIGIDYGSKRVGLAISDSGKIIASPLETIHSKDVFSHLQKIVERSTIEAMVVGIPTDLRGNPTDSTKICQDFVIALRRKFKDLKIFEVDERFTSKMAADTLIQAGAKLKTRRDKSMLDKVSAAILLQSFLDAGLR